MVRPSSSTTFDYDEDQIGGLQFVGRATKLGRAVVSAFYSYVGDAPNYVVGNRVVLSNLKHLHGVGGVMRTKKDAFTQALDITNSALLCLTHD